jgi:hypothetical protein
MIQSQTAHTLLLAAVVVTCGVVMNRPSLASASQSTAHTTAELKSVNSLKSGEIAPCSESLTAEGCFAVPVAVQGSDANGKPTTVVTQYAVGPNFVDQIKKDFADSANVVLRQLRPTLQNAAHTGDLEVKKTSLMALAEINAAVPYFVQPGIKMPLKVEKKVAEIAKKQYAKSGRPIVITSGTRTPESQADAMRTKLSMGDNVMRLYRNKRAVASIVHAYKEAKHWGVSDEQVTEHMANVIEKQVQKGVFISSHLKSGAIDIRTRDLSPEERHELVATVQNTPGVVRSIQESIPPHLHLELQ